MTLENLFEVVGSRMLIYKDNCSYPPRIGWMIYNIFPRTENYAYYPTKNAFELASELWVGAGNEAKEIAKVFRLNTAISVSEVKRIYGEIRIRCENEGKVEVVTWLSLIIPVKV